MSGCDEIRAWIVRSIDGDLNPREALVLARHLATCTACRIVLARETRLAEMLDDVDDSLVVNEEFFRHVMVSLPELPPRPAVGIKGSKRWRRGLRLAAFASVTAVGAGLAARLLPSLRLDVATPAMPRFTPDDTDGWVSLIGSAAQWIRMTAESVAWAGGAGTASPWTIGALSVTAMLACAAAMLALSGALAWAARPRSRVS